MREELYRATMAGVLPGVAEELEKCAARDIIDLCDEIDEYQEQIEALEKENRQLEEAIKSGCDDVDYMAQQIETYVSADLLPTIFFLRGFGILNDWIVRDREQKKHRIDCINRECERMMSSTKTQIQTFARKHNVSDSGTKSAIVERVRQKRIQEV